MAEKTIENKQPNISLKQIACQLQKVRQDIDLDVLSILFKNYKIHKQSIGSGGDFKKVYLLENSQTKKSFVIKISPNFIFEKLDSLRAKATHWKKEAVFLQEYYGYNNDIIPDELVTIMAINKDGKLGIVVFQELAGYNIRDIFTEINQTELVSIIRQDDQLKKNFCDFVEKTVKLRQKQGKLIDLFGFRNLILVENKKGDNSLKFIDPHKIVSSEDAEAFYYRRYMKNETYLKKIVREINS